MCFRLPLHCKYIYASVTLTRSYMHTNKHTYVRICIDRSKTVWLILTACHSVMGYYMANRIQCMFIFTFFCVQLSIKILTYTVLSNTNNFSTDLINPYKESKQVLPLRVRVECEVMSVKEYATLPVSPIRNSTRISSPSTFSKRSYICLLRVVLEKFLNLTNVY